MEKKGIIALIRTCMLDKQGMKTTVLSRILRLSVLMTVAAIVILSMYYVTFSRSKLDKAHQDQVTNYSRASAANLAEWVNLVKEELATVANEEKYLDPSYTLAERKEMLEVAASTTAFKDLSVAYADGTTYNDTDISERTYFKSAYAGKAYVSSPVVRKTDGSLTIMAGSKITVDGYDGVIYGGMDVDFFSDILDVYDLGEQGYVFILDADGNVIAHPDEQLVIDMANPVSLAESDETYSGFAELASAMLAGSDGYMTISMPDGNKYLAGYCPVGNTEGWSVAVMLGVDELNQDYNQLIRYSVIVTLLLLIVSMDVALVVATKIAYPLRVASTSISRMAEGDLSSEREEVTVRSDEAGRLLENYDRTKDQLSEYITDIADSLERITKGDLTESVTNEYKGDFEKIKTSLNNIIESLNRTFKRANEAAGNMLEGSRQVESASQALAAATTEQASAVVEITASIEGIAKSTENNTGDVLRVNELTRGAKAQADEGDAQMTRMIGAMDEINEASANIAKIMKVIDDIAFQTNILALNASVEAARAGVHGRGFAVVAEEVRNLAGKSAAASAEISEMLDDTISKIKAGSDIAADTAGDLKKIVAAIDEIAGIMERIAEVSKDQAEAVEQVNAGIEQISSAVQNNSATSQECAASSAELANQARGLADQIRYFRTK